MKKIILIVIMIIMATLYSVADDKSFYFIAKSTSEGVYLRWDAIEGNFPKDSDIDLIVLKRGDVNITSFNPNSIMSTEQIEAIYGQPVNQNSLKKIIASISNNDDPTCSGANLSNYASKIEACMQNNLWRYMASKVDFNIATIGYRAYLDAAIKTKETSGTVTYELVAVKQVNGENVTERLGKVEVDPTVTTSIMGASNFKQVTQSSACNAPEYAKDDYTVALSWENGGEKTDAFANSIMLAGYDLYRVKGSENDIVFDPAALVGKSTVDANGDYVFAGLEKVNDVPLLLANKKGEEKTLFLETKNQLKKAGLKPGDKRWYYLVAKDFTGHYGPTVKWQVVIPDLLAPQTPWGIRAIEHDKKAKLIWENVNVASYVNHYKNSRKFCNIGTLSPKERLRFVDKDGTCGTKEIEVNLNVDKYYVYRFTNPADAAKFADSDLDGIGDLDETKEKVCKATPILNASSKLDKPLIKIIDANDFRGKKFVTFVDDSVTDSKYYWYRVVAARAGGVDRDIGSIMSVPVRAMIPNRTLPNKVEVELKACSSNYIVASYSFDGELDYLAYDNTGLAKSVRLTGVIVLPDGSSLDARQGVYLPVKDDGFVDFPQKWGSCQFGTIEFLDAKGNVLASKTLCSNVLDYFANLNSTDGRKCKAREFYVLDENNCEYGGLEKVHDGQDVYTFPIMIFSTNIKEDECFEITQTLDNKRYKRATICDKVDKYDTKELNLSNLGKGEKFCLGVNMLNANNQYSPTTYLPCFGVVDQAKPNRPDMKKIRLNTNNITVSWVSPQEKVTATMVSIKNDNNQTYLRTFPHPDHINKVSMDKLVMSRDINVTLSNENRVQEWCAKVKSIGFNGKTSEWSSEKCTKISKDGTEIEEVNLAWPEIKGVSTSSEDVLFMYTFYGSSIKSLVMPLKRERLSINFEEDFSYNNIFDNESGLKNNVCDFFDDERFYNPIEKVLQSTKLDFVLYRQEIKNGDKSNFVQISSLLNRVKYKRIAPLGGCDTFSKMRRFLVELEDNLYVIVQFVALDATNKSFNMELELFYKDNYPYKANTTYRYVKVNFDKNHEIESYNVSNEVTTTQGGQQ